MLRTILGAKREKAVGGCRKKQDQVRKNKKAVGGYRK
jgi:hypothetical protein